MQEICFFVIPGNTKITSIENFAQFVADQIHNGLEVQLGGEPLLDGIDDLQLGDAFLLGPKEALSLIEETRVLEGGSQRGGDSGQQADFGFAVGILTLMVFHGNVAKHTVTTDNGDMDF